MSNERLQLEAQRSKAVLEQMQIKNQLQWLTGFDSKMQPQSDTSTVMLHAPPTELTLQNNRFIRIQRNTLEVLDKEKAVISANALPTFQLGGSNMSIRGWETIGNQDVYHEPTDRFTSINFSIQWPRSRKATKNDLNVNRLQIEQQQLKLNAEETLLSTEYQNALNNWLSAHDMLIHQRDNTIQNTKIIMRECDLQLETGSISWIEWSAMMRQALQTRLSLIDLTAYYNETAIQLKTLLNNE
jgi:cobalt-zinc-cadmium resistance protein CzcA